MKSAHVLITLKLIFPDSLDSTQFMEVILSRPDGHTILFLQACQSGQQETAMKLLLQLKLTSHFVLRALEKCWGRGHFELANLILTHFLQKLNTTQIEFRRLVQGLSRYRQEIPAAVAVIPTAYFEGMWRRQPPESAATLLAYHRDNPLDSWHPDKHLYMYLGRWGQSDVIAALAKISGPDTVYPPIRKTALGYGRTTLVEAIHFLHPMPLTERELQIIVERGDVNLVGQLRQCRLLTDAHIEYILSEVPSSYGPSYKRLCGLGHWRMLDVFLKISGRVRGNQVWWGCHKHPKVMRTMLQYPIIWQELDAHSIFNTWIKYLKFPIVYSLIKRGCPHYVDVAQSQPEMSLSLTIRGVDVLAQHVWAEDKFKVIPGPTQNIYHEQIDVILTALSDVFPRGISRCILEYV
jgi:hypothetical protein